MVTKPAAGDAPKAAAKPPAPPQDAPSADEVREGDTVTREAAAAKSATLTTVQAVRDFTLNRDDGTSRQFHKGLNRDVTQEDADHWFVAALTEGGPKSGVADVRPLVNPNGVVADDGAAPPHDPQLESTTVALDAGKGEGGTGADANAYSEDDAQADRARAEAGDADAQARLDAYEAALKAAPTA